MAAGYSAPPCCGRGVGGGGDIRRLGCLGCVLSSRWAVGERAPLAPVFSDVDPAANTLTSLSGATQLYKSPGRPAPCLTGPGLGWVAQGRWSTSTCTPSTARPRLRCSWPAQVRAAISGLSVYPRYPPRNLARTCGVLMVVRAFRLRGVRHHRLVRGERVAGGPVSATHALHIRTAAQSNAVATPCSPSTRRHADSFPQALR
jgi:hypothetical protein